MCSIENLGLLAELNLSLLFMEILLFGSSLFLMLLILVQRGKGGGLTGALGGMGGQSAFGSKAGDAFTKITVVTAVIWIMLCMVTIAAFNPPPAPKQTKNDEATITSMMGGAEDEEGDAEADTESGDSSLGENGFSSEGTDEAGESTEDSNEANEASDENANEPASTEGDQPESEDN